MLSDTSSLAPGYVGQANRVKQCCLAVIDVAHDGYHRRTRNALNRGPVFARTGFGDFLLGLFFEGYDIGISAEKSRHVSGKFSIKRLVDSCKHAAPQQARD